MQELKLLNHVSSNTVLRNEEILGSDLEILSREIHLNQVS